MTASKIAAFDVDGVVLSFDQKCQEVASALLGRPITRLTGSFDFSERYGITAEEGERIWAKFADPALWENLPVFPGAVDAVRATQDAGFEVVFVTAIAKEAVDARIQNLKNIGIEDFRLIETGAWNLPKEKILAQLAPALFVDDRLAHLAAAPATIPTKVWIDNGDIHPVAADAIPNLIRVSSLAEWADGFLQQSA